MKAHSLQRCMLFHVFFLIVSWCPLRSFAVSFGFFVIQDLPNRAATDCQKCRAPQRQWLHSVYTGLWQKWDSDQSSGAPPSTKCFFSARLWWTEENAWIGHKKYFPKSEGTQKVGQTIQKVKIMPYPKSSDVVVAWFEKITWAKTWHVGHRYITREVLGIPTCTYCIDLHRAFSRPFNIWCYLESLKGFCLKNHEKSLTWGSDLKGFNQLDL